MPTGELYKHVNDFCNVAGGTSLAAIHRALQNGRYFLQVAGCRLQVEI